MNTATPMPSAKDNTAYAIAVFRCDSGNHSLINIKVQASPLAAPNAVTKRPTINNQYRFSASAA